MAIVSLFECSNLVIKRPCSCAVGITEILLKCGQFPDPLHPILDVVLFYDSRFQNCVLVHRFKYQEISSRDVIT